MGMHAYPGLTTIFPLHVTYMQVHIINVLHLMETSGTSLENNA
jgi:hypothetical protein